MLPIISYILNACLILTLIGLSVFYLFQLKKYRKNIDEGSNTLLSSRRIYQIILETLDFESVVQKIADTIPSELKFGTGVVAVLDENRGVIRRVAASRTQEAIDALNALKADGVPFENIEISIKDPTNKMARALRERTSFVTDDLCDVMCPALTPLEAKKIQQIMGTKTTLVYPFFIKDKPIGVFLASTKKQSKEITESEYYIIGEFVNLVGLILQNSKLFTQLKEARDALAKVNVEVSRMNVQLQELDKLKDDFVSIASHELRTPMTAIRAYVWMALNRSDIPLSEKLKKYLQRTLVSTERLINLVNDMLNISRIESGRIEIIPRSFDLKTLVQDVLFEVEAKASEKNIHIKADAVALPFVFADADKVHQVLLNLVGNALKFTPVDGEIDIKFFSDGNWLEVEVKDNGVGISREDLAKLFQKFGRLDNSYVAAATSGGTGLGLYICKSLINMMGGNIWAVSDGLGKGTSFIFSLPVANKQHLAESYKFTKKSVGEAKGLEPATL